MYVVDLLPAGAVHLQADVKSKDEAIGLLVELMDAQGVLKDKQRFLADVMKREAMGTTGVSEGLAFPHANSDCVSQVALSAITIPTGVDFKAADGSPAKMIFMLAVPKSQADSTVKLLGKLALILLEKETREKLLGVEDVQVFLKYLNRLEAKKSPDIL